MTSVGYLERVTLPHLGQAVVAKIDTGADGCSISAEYARGLSLTGTSVTVRSANGRQSRPRVILDFVLAGRSVRVVASIADRPGMTCPVVIGRTGLAGFLVDPSRTFLHP